MLIAVVVVVVSLPFEALAADTAYAYVSDVQITSYEDGMAPFDNGDTPGNDSSNHNNIVRSFDDTKYNIAFTTTALSPTEKYTKFVVYVKVELDADITQAIFDTAYMDKNNQSAQMAWVDEYTLEYFDKDGKSLGVGVNQRPSYRANNKNTGSTAGENSYRSDVVKQVITLKRELGDGVTAFSSIARELEIFISVKGAMNGTTFQPKFSVYAENNEKNVDRSGQPLENSATAAPVTVSAVGSFDVFIWNRNSVTRNWYDLANDKVYTTRTGHAGFDGVENYTETSTPAYDIRPIVMWSMYGQSDNPSIITQKGIKGCELPTGDAYIKLQNYASVATEDNKGLVEGYIKPTIWEHGYNNAYASSPKPTWDDDVVGAFGREVGKLTMSISNVDRTDNFWGFRSATTAMNWSTGITIGQRQTVNPKGWDTNHHSAYDSGDVTTTFKKDTAFDMTLYKTEEEGSLYDEIVFSDYDIDLDDWRFPINASNAGVPYINAEYTAGFASYQMFMATPTVLNTKRYTTTVTKVVDAKINSMSGNVKTCQALTDNDSFAVGGTESVSGNNSIKNNWLSYNKMKPYIEKNKHTWYVYKDNDMGSLSTSGKSSSNYDAGTYAGSKVYACTFIQMQNSSETITDMNFLQMIDPAVTILKDEGTEWSFYGNPTGTDCKYKVLYAADPLFPDGYNTEIKAHCQRINAVMEEDLIYFNSYEECEAAGFTCVGILHEFRDANIYTKRTGGNTLAVAVPVRMTDNFSDMGNTYQFCGKARTWSNNEMHGISWSDGSMNYLTADDDISTVAMNMDDANPVYTTHWYDQEDADFNPLTISNKLENYSNTYFLRYECVMGVTTSRGRIVRNLNGFQKARFKDGKLTSGIGYNTLGNSIMIIGYKAATKITTEGKRYDLDKGQRIVKVTVSGQATNSIGAENAGGWKYEEHRDNVVSTVTIPDDLSFRENTISIQGQRISTSPDNPTLINYSCRAQDHNYQVSSYCWCEVNGKTLTVHYPNAYIPAELPNIEFETQISPFTLNNTTMTITNSITGEGCAVNGGETSSASFSTIVLASTSVFKDVDRTSVEIGGDIVYTVEYDNLSLVEAQDVWLYDVLPYNGDNRGSDFNGSFEIVDIWSDSNAAFTYYTTSDDPDLIANDMADSWSNWDKYFSTENTIVDNATAVFCKIENVKSYDSFALKIKIRTSDNKGGDTYDNNAYIWETSKSDNAQLTTNVVETKVLSRSVEGFCWIDTNEDGDFSDTEKKLSGITVTLLQKRDNEWLPAKDVEGGDVPLATTDENGAYRFNNLAAGDYIIVFDGNFDNFIGATQYISGNNGLNNKAVTSEIEGHQYQTKFTSSQTEITLPEADEMTFSEYVLSGMNLGVVEPEIKLPSSGVDWMLVIMSVGLAVIIIGLLASKKNLKSKPRLS